MARAPGGWPVWEKAQERNTKPLLLLSVDLGVQEALRLLLANFDSLGLQEVTVRSAVFGQGQQLCW